MKRNRIPTVIKFITAVLLVSLLQACTDQDLQTVATALTDTAKAVAVFQQTAIQANSQGLLPDPTTRQLLEVSIRVNQAGVDAVTITRNLTQLKAEDRSKILGILRPVIDALASADSEVVTSIPNERTRATIRTALVLIQTSLNTAQLALAAR